MKKQVCIAALFALSAHSLSAQVITHTVSVGAGYINQTFYSLENEEQGSPSKDNWDIAFELNGYTSSILANTQRPNFALYKAPYSIANYGSIDTTGISGWPGLYNSDTTWTAGAFNRSANLSNASDLGWGLYDMNTHFVNGDSCYVVKLSTTVFKKLKIVSLVSGVYTFEFANIDGTSSQTITIAKASYPGKNFVYYDLAANAAVDREPLAASWDLLFGRYTAFIPTPYPVVGVIANKGVTIAQLNDVANPSSFNTWAGAAFNTNMTTIGNDWKSINLNTNQWAIVNDTIYLVNDRSGNIWKVRFTGFGGSANGNFIFTKEKLSTVGIANVAGQQVTQVSIYPNPAVGDQTTLLFTTEIPRAAIHIEIADVSGKTISSEDITVESGLNKHLLNTAALNSGVYFVRISAGSFNSIQKLIK